MDMTVGHNLFDLYALGRRHTLQHRRAGAQDPPYLHKIFTAAIMDSRNALATWWPSPLATFRSLSLSSPTPLLPSLPQQPKSAAISARGPCTPATQGRAKEYNNGESSRLPGHYERDESTNQ